MSYCSFCQMIVSCTTGWRPSKRLALFC